MARVAARSSDVMRGPNAGIRSWTASSAASCACNESGRFSYASAMFTQIVSPPAGGHSTQRSSEAIDGV